MAQSNPVFKHSSFKGLIGIAQEDITPPVEIYSRNWGASKYDVAEGIHRPLMLTCITFQSVKQGKPLVLISADLGWWRNYGEERSFRNNLLTSLNMEAEQLMFCLSHTHAGPVLSPDEAAKPGGRYILPYFKNIHEAALKAVNYALSSAVPSILTWHYGKCNLATNRDLPDPENKRFVVGFNPAKEADDTLLVGRITDEQDRITGTIVNYACHPTTLAWENRLISPDYVGAMREIVESTTQAPCLFLQGASGELSPAEQYTGDTEVADKNGRQLGYAVITTLESMLPPKRKLAFSSIVESGAPLAVWKQNVYHPSSHLASVMIEVPFHLKPMPSLEEIEQQYNDCEDRVIRERLGRKRSIRKAIGDGDVARIPLWIWRLGDSFLVGQPNEAYSEFQKELRKQLSPKAVAVMNIVNGGVGYLPPQDLYDKDIYQEWQTPFASGSLELLTKTAVKAAEEIFKAD